MRRMIVRTPPYATTDWTDLYASAQKVIQVETVPPTLMTVLQANAI